MKIVTAEMIRELDRRAMQEFGIPGIVLMENAGRAVVEVMEREFAPLAGKRIIVVCGAGNNGGDGFVIARYLLLAEAHVDILLAGSIPKLKDDAAVQFNALCTTHANARFVELNEGGVGAGALLQKDVIVDALLGTGFHDAPGASYAKIIAAINASGLPIIAVDIPSGVNADTGATPGEAVRATHTVTFAYPKLGMFLPPGAQCVGKLHTASIGFDWKQLEADTPYYWITPESARQQIGTLGNIGTRKPEANKGDFGHVAVIAGSRGMAGAPAIVARAAQRSGAGLVTVLAPAGVQPTIGAKLDEQMTLALPEEDGSLSEAAFDAIAKFAEKATVLCVGPGLTTHPQTVALVQRIIAEIEKPIVLDADGLNALAMKPDIINRRAKNPRAPLVLTPHPGEAARLLGTEIPDVQSNRVGAAVELARRYQASVVLKGRYSLVADPHGRIAINTSGNPGMATGGSGDALTGIIGGLLAQGTAPGKAIIDLETYLAMTARAFDVTAFGVLLHGMAGDLAAERHGEVGMTAGDIVESVPPALRRLEETH